MSVSTEVQRTLVKSPPELWAELSSSESLARHLGEVGEIRITKVEPETRVEWEADQVSGVVELKQSGWGTRVKLSLMRELPRMEAEVPAEAEAMPEQEETEAETIADAELSAEPSGTGEQMPVAETAAVVEPEPAREPAPVETESEPVALTPEPEPVQAVTVEPKQGFFARLLKRRKTVEAPAEPEPVVATGTEPEPEPGPTSPIELHAMAWPEPIYPEPPPKPVEPEPNLAAELAELEAQLQQESAELLTGVLDRLGSAHHRPFSRA